MDEKKMRMELLNTYSFRELAEMYLRALGELERLKEELACKVEILEAAIQAQETLQKALRNARGK